MKTERFDDQLNGALASLKSCGGEAELEGFEQEVWSEIAIREDGGESWFSLSRSAAAACALLAVGFGSLFGLTRAQAYEEEASREFEQRYVKSIHPVMMSAGHVGHDH